MASVERRLCKKNRVQSSPNVLRKQNAVIDDSSDPNNFYEIPPLKKKSQSLNDNIERWDSLETAEYFDCLSENNEDKHFQNNNISQSADLLTKEAKDDPDLFENKVKITITDTEVEKHDTYNGNTNKNAEIDNNLNGDITETDANAIRAELMKRWAVRRFKLVRGNGEKTDPFQFFEVEREPCHFLRVRVLRGRNITKGLFGDIMDTPDPYVIVHIRNAPEGRKMTRHIDNVTDPEWDEELTYLLDPAEEKVTAEIILMDKNYSVDEKMASVEFDLGNIPLDETIYKTFSLNETSEVDISFLKEVKFDTDIRASLALCHEEKEFRSVRKRIVYTSIKKLMKSGPMTLRETPTIAVLGSGGGFRAMTGYSGAIKALHDSGLLNCVTYIAGLSGSSWYVSTLYAHEDFPHKGTDGVNGEIRDNISNSPFWLLRPECLMRYSRRLHAKKKSGQPVTFTDFFGLLIGQTLLGPTKMETAKLSDFKEKIKDGAAPMPLLTCLHVRPNMSAMKFHDWVEFSPYEIGIAKYAAFMSTTEFGSKFFMGILAKKFEETPLHFLMGIWGSAFSILFNRLVDKSKGKNINHKVDEREAMESELTESFKRGSIRQQKRMSKRGSGPNDVIDVDSSDSDDDNDDDEDDDNDFVDASERLDINEKDDQQESQKSWSSWIFGSSAPSSDKNEKKQGGYLSTWIMGSGKENDAENNNVDEAPKKSMINSFATRILGQDFMESREYRAGKILNYMRGISLNQTFPLSPFTPKVMKSNLFEEDEFLQIHEPIEVKKKKVHLVDSGLTFNSPYPVLLRPQRAVDLILSFDFSARPSDNHEPFKEILLAEKWARLHHLAFPKIDRTVYDREGMKECYVFKDDTDDRAPIIIHFVLVNLSFRKFSKPGVPRQPCDTRGDFDIFDTPKTPYSTFNFQYSNEAFDQLHELVEYNTLLHIDTIKEQIANCVSLRRYSQNRCSITLNDIRNSLHMSAKNKKNLEKVLKTTGSNGSICLD